MCEIFMSIFFTPVKKKDSFLNYFSVLCSIIETATGVKPLCFRNISEVLERVALMQVFSTVVNLYFKTIFKHIVDIRYGKCSFFFYDYLMHIAELGVDNPLGAPLFSFLNKSNLSPFIECLWSN